MDIVLTSQLVAAVIVALLVAYNLFHYVLFLLVTRPKDASKIGHQLNEFEQRQLIEWTPKPNDFLKHDDEKRTYDDVFGTYRDEQSNYSTCVFPRLAFSHPYEAECALLKPKDGMRFLDLGCGSGAAAEYLAGRSNIEIVCVTNSSVQAEICRRKFARLGGRGQVIVIDFDSLDLPNEHFDAIYALEFDWLHKGPGRVASQMLADAQAGRTVTDPFAGVAGSLSPYQGLPECHRLLRELALQFCRSQSSRLQDAPTWLQSNPLSATTILGLGSNLELHSTHAIVEVPAKDAHIRGTGANHLAHVEGVCVWQPVQHGAGHQTQGTILLPNSRIGSSGWRCRD